MTTIANKYKFREPNIWKWIKGKLVTYERKTANGKS